jgi:hypothetical protein
MPGSFFSDSISRAIGSANFDMICIQESLGFSNGK